MATRTKSIRDLARVVDRRLKRDGEVSPGITPLTRLFEVVYFTSLKTEEGRTLQVRVSFVDPSDHDPDRPPAPRPDRWKISKLASRLPLNVPTLVKLSKAVDPWSSCLAVYHDHAGEFFIWGLADQMVHFNTYLVREKEFGYAPPGLFQLVATGTADLSIYREHDFVARLGQDTLSQRQNDVFWSGPVSDRLQQGVRTCIEDVWKKLARIDYIQDVISGYREDGDWDALIEETWMNTLCRILISIQRYHHGGALLITNSKADLDVKYKINYSRLKTALVRMWTSRLLSSMAEEQIHDGYLDTDKELMPVGLYLDKSIAAYDEQDYRDEITGCVRFISSLSCVDGLVLASPDFVIRGFGAMIRTEKDVGSAFFSPGPKATQKSLRKFDPNHYGSRHRTMMRCCSAHPKSVGFVVSQDGEIRVMTKVKNRLVMWENLKVLDFRDNFLPRRKEKLRKTSAPQQLPSPQPSTT
jgi:hypothetical protein